MCVFISLAFLESLGFDVGDANNASVAGGPSDADHANDLGNADIAYERMTL